MDKRQSKTGVVRIRRFKGRMYTQTASGRDNNYVRSDPCHVDGRIATRKAERFPVAMLNRHVGVFEYFARNAQITGGWSFGTI